MIIAIISWGLTCLLAEYALGVTLVNANLIVSLLFALVIGALFETVRVR